MCTFGPRRAFKVLLKKAYGLKHMSYWERLNELKLTSMERRVERYKAIYVYKMLNGLVPNIGLCVNDNTPCTRSEISLIPCKIGAKSAKIKTKQKNSILNCGVRIYNALPIEIRSISDDLISFKTELDLFLSKVPDQPAVPGFKPGSHDLYGKSANSIIDWIRTHNILYDYHSNLYTNYECV